MQSKLIFRTRRVNSHVQKIFIQSVERPSFACPAQRGVKGSIQLRRITRTLKEPLLCAFLVLITSTKTFYLKGWIQLKRLVSVIVIVSVILSMVPVGAVEATTIDEIRAIDPEFSNDFIITDEVVTALDSPLGNALLVDFYEEDEPVAYAIIVDGVIYEFASHTSPFRAALDSFAGFELYFDPAAYCYLDEDNVYLLNSLGDIVSVNPLNNTLPLENISGGVAVCGTLPGVSPQLQGSTNCVAAALANVFWYLGSHGFSALTSSISFESLKDRLQNLFLHNGGLANRNVPTVANLYAQERSSSLACSSTVVWNPTIITVVNEIGAGYPCMLGYSSSNTYYSAPHMTMCCGYQEATPGFYVKLVDGHSTSIIMRLWDSSNDCVITVRPYYTAG